MRPVRDELVRKRVYQDAAHWDGPLLLPRSHDASEPLEVSVARFVPGFNGGDFGARVRDFPTPASVTVRVREAAPVLVHEAWQNLEGDAVGKLDGAHLPVGAELGCGVGLLDGRADRLEKRRLPIPGVLVVLLVDRVRQPERHIEVADGVDSGVTSIRADVDAVRGVAIGVPEVGI